MTPFVEYAREYDVFYSRKDYAAEVEYVLGLAGRFGNDPDRVLDMGCGTGRHLAEFCKRDVRCDGFDRSPEMLEQAKQRLSGCGVSLWLGNLNDFRSEIRYDLAVAMFATMGYLVSNEDLAAGFRTAAHHLRPGGLFMFDGWFGPAVLAQVPRKRTYTYTNDGAKLTREATPSLDAVRQAVLVHYEVELKRDGQILRRFVEDHCMRFFFVQEVSLLSADCGMEMLHACPFLKPEGELGTDTWNASFVIRKPA